jgi:hypothetical protein
MYRFRLSLDFALLVLGVVLSASAASSREVPVYCYPPTATTVAPGATFNGKVCGGYWGCVCEVQFCPQCSTLPSPPLSCSLTNCRNLPRPSAAR